MPDIVISEFMEPAAIDRLRDGFTVHYDPQLFADPARLNAAVGGCRALIVRNATQVRAPLLAAARNLGIIGRLGVGLDNIDTELCAAGGIKVVPATGANAISVAELAIGAMLVLMRGTYHVSDRLRAGEWPRLELMGREIFGKTLGLVGFGHVAMALAERARGMGLAVIAHDPAFADDDPVWRARGAEPASLARILAEADILSVHVPLTDATRNLIGAAELALMKPRAIVINTARGGIVDERALAAALKAGRIAGAALDVFETEPFDRASPLADAPNALLMPHVGAMTEESNQRVCSMIADAVIAHLRGA
ncbi:MAG: hydroxyacid dehydrogenase [Alphaproteobacteria bacterium]